MLVAPSRSHCFALLEAHEMYIDGSDPVLFDNVPIDNRLRNRKFMIACSFSLQQEYPAARPVDRVIAEELYD